MPYSNHVLLACPTSGQVGHEVGHGSRASEVGHHVLLDAMPSLREAWKVGHGQSRAWSRNLIIINPFACSLLSQSPDHVLLSESNGARDMPPLVPPCPTLALLPLKVGHGKVGHGMPSIMSSIMSYFMSYFMSYSRIRNYNEEVMFVDWP